MKPTSNKIYPALYRTTDKELMFEENKGKHQMCAWNPHYISLTCTCYFDYLGDV